MKFISIYLEGFKYFPLRNNEPFFHEFGKKLTMITGRNGSGKSSLFYMLTPLPADKNSFYAGKGLCKVVIQKNNDIYELISDFRDKTNFSFLFNNEELNTAGLVTAQKELVYKHFGITQVVHDIMVDREQFCTMSLNNRKKLFSTITHMNIDSVLDGYNKLKEEIKANNLFIKSTTSSLIIEEGKLLSTEDKDHAVETVKTIEKNIDSLLDFRNSVLRHQRDPSSVNFHEKLFYLSNKLKDAIQLNYMLLTAYPYKDIPKLKESNLKTLASVTERLSSKYQQLEALQDEQKSMTVTESVDMVQLEAAIVAANTSIENLTKKLCFFKSDDEVNDFTQSAAYKLEVSLPELVRNMLTNTGLEGERIYTVAGYNELVEKKNKVQEELQHNLSLELSIKSHLNNISSVTGDISCPSCDHTWSAKDALLASSHGAGELEEIAKKVIELKGKLRSLDSTIEEHREYFNLYRQVTAIRKDTEQYLPSFWNKIQELDLIMTDPPSMVGYVNTLILDISTIDEIRRIKQELSYNLKAYDAAKRAAELSNTDLYNKIELLTSECVELQEEKDHLREQADWVNKAEQEYEKIRSIQDSIDAAKENIRIGNFTYAIDCILDVIDREIREQKVILVKYEGDLRQSETIQYGIDRYKKELDDLQENLKVLELAVAELCPKSGLIAMSVSSFLNTIINNINKSIGSVWDYKMELKQIDVGVDPLNYKFKVMVEDSLDISDVSVISSGMKEIINIAFKQVLYRLLGFEGYPFYLDEAGSKLDVHHRAKFFHMLFGLITDTAYSQVMMITHIDNAILSNKDTEAVEL